MACSIRIGAPTSERLARYGLQGPIRTQVRVFLGVIDAESFVQAAKLLDILVLEHIAGMGTHLHRCREQQTGDPAMRLYP